MNCPKCGAYNYDTRTTCVLCGAVLSKPKPPDQQTIIPPGGQGGQQTMAVPGPSIPTQPPIPQAPGKSNQQTMAVPGPANPNQPIYPGQAGYVPPGQGSQQTMAVPGPSYPNPPAYPGQQGYSGQPGYPPPPVQTGQGQPGYGYPPPAAPMPAYMAPEKKKSNPWLVTCGVALGILLCLGLLAGGGGFYMLYYLPTQQASQTALAQTTLDAQATLNAHATGTQVAIVSSTAALRATQSARSTATALATQAALATQHAAGTQTAAVQATATAQAKLAYALLPNNYKLIFKDPFDNNTNNWDTGSVNNDYWTGSRTINNGVYTWSATATKGFATWEQHTLSQDTSSFYMVVDAKKLSGGKNDCYGVVFRGNASKHYAFEVCDDVGQYSLSVYTDKWTTVIDYTDNSAIKTGDTNRIALLAQGSHYTLIINGQKVDETTDSTLTSGYFGIISEASSGDQASWQFDNLEVYAP